MDEGLRKIFAQRLRQARTRAGLSMDDLCRKMDGVVSRQAIFKYENGEMLPDGNRLMKLSLALGQDLDFFFRPIRFDVNVGGISFRKTRIKGKALDALKVSIQDATERHLEINDILGFANNKFRPIEPPREKLCTAQDMADCARETRRVWKLGATAPIFNAQILLIQHGIDVIYCDGMDKFDAVSLVASGKPIVVMNKNKDMAERRRFSAMHELGHLLFNKHMDDVEDRQKEKLCHTFANEMLLPASVVDGLFKCRRNISLEALYCVQSIYGISVDAIMYKLKSMNIVTEKRYRSYCIMKNDPVLKGEIELSRFKEEPTRMFEAKVYNALAQNVITERKAASLLGMPVNEVCNKVNAI